MKHKQTYGVHEEGNTLSYDDFQKYLTNELKSEIIVERDIVPRMKDIVIDCFMSVKN